MLNKNKNLQQFIKYQQTHNLNVEKSITYDNKMDIILWLIDLGIDVNNIDSYLKYERNYNYEMNDINNVWSNGVILSQVIALVVLKNDREYIKEVLEKNSKSNKRRLIIVGTEINVKSNAQVYRNYQVSLKALQSKYPFYNLCLEADDLINDHDLIWHLLLYIYNHLKLVNNILLEHSSNRTVKHNSIVRTVSFSTSLKSKSDEKEVVNKIKSPSPQRTPIKPNDINSIKITTNEKTKVRSRSYSPKTRQKVHNNTTTTVVKSIHSSPIRSTTPIKPTKFISSDSTSKSNRKLIRKSNESANILDNKFINNDIFAGIKPINSPLLSLYEKRQLRRLELGITTKTKSNRKYAWIPPTIPESQLIVIKQLPIQLINNIQVYEIIKWLNSINIIVKSGEGGFYFNTIDSIKDNQLDIKIFNKLDYKGINLPIPLYDDNIRNGVIFYHILLHYEPYLITTSNLSNLYYFQPKTIHQIDENLNRVLWLLKLYKCPPIPVQYLSQSHEIIQGNKMITWGLLYELLQVYYTNDKNIKLYLSEDILNDKFVDDKTKSKLTESRIDDKSSGDIINKTSTKLDSEFDENVNTKGERKSTKQLKSYTTLNKKLLYNPIQRRMLDLSLIHWLNELNILSHFFNDLNNNITSILTIQSLIKDGILLSILLTKHLSIILIKSIYNNPTNDKERLYNLYVCIHSLRITNKKISHRYLYHNVEYEILLGENWDSILGLLEDIHRCYDNIDVINEIDYTEPYLGSYKHIQPNINDYIFDDKNNNANIIVNGISQDILLGFDESNTNSSNYIDNLYDYTAAYTKDPALDIIPKSNDSNMINTITNLYDATYYTKHLDLSSKSLQSPISNSKNIISNKRYDEIISNASSPSAIDSSDINAITSPNSITNDSIHDSLNHSLNKSYKNSKPVIQGSISKVLYNSNHNYIISNVLIWLYSLNLITLQDLQSNQLPDLSDGILLCKIILLLEHESFNIPSELNKGIHWIVKSTAQKKQNINKFFNILKIKMKNISISMLDNYEIDINNGKYDSIVTLLDVIRKSYKYRHV